MLYDEWAAIEPKAREAVLGADAAIVTSLCPHGPEAADLVRARAPFAIFYDLDTPTTLGAPDGPPAAYLPRDGMLGFDLVLSATGGPALGPALARRFGADPVWPLYGGVDPRGGTRRSQARGAPTSRSPTSGRTRPTASGCSPRSSSRAAHAACPIACSSSAARSTRTTSRGRPTRSSSPTSIRRSTAASTAPRRSRSTSRAPRWHASGTARRCGSSRRRHARPWSSRTSGRASRRSSRPVRRSSSRSPPTTSSARSSSARGSSPASAARRGSASSTSTARPIGPSELLWLMENGASAAP